MIVVSQNLTEVTNGSYILLDTNVLSECVRSKELYDQLIGLIQNNTSFYTINLVLLETLHGHSTTKEFKDKRDFVESICKIVDPLRQIPPKRLLSYSVVCTNNNYKNPSQVDFLLSAILYNYSINGSKCYVLTADKKAMPTFYDIVSVVTIAREKSVTNYVLYAINLDNFDKAAKNVLKEVNNS
jgi:hypothetical protein